MAPLPPFIRPHLNLPSSSNDYCSSTSSLPQLITFTAEHNPHHTFALQLRASEPLRCELSFAQLRRMVERASAWLVSSGTTMGRERREEKPVPPPYEDHLPTDLDALILHASGTTGYPKPIYHSHAFLLLFAPAHRFEEKIGEGYSVVTSPLYPGFGLLAPLLSMAVRLGEEWRRTKENVCSRLRPPGWKEEFLLKDLLWAAPSEAAREDLQLDLNPIPHCTPFPSTSLNHTKPKQYKILSRTNTLLVLSNGEKVNPEFAEKLIGEHPDVRGVLAFGKEEASVGVVVEHPGPGGIRPHPPHKGEAEVGDEHVFVLPT
ncbi:hypothetical protein K443DRAFT_13740 [Laccaria amethystina LaAM-08-1]|uniref:Unplaced genomic scaffold K443scaffold_389, whole genome shotgun sequence n=1 Tax=Laccaria amethystina LaAM-08-1 TaxID=1095629 RepID=A0A0C9WUL5_9AGAR|nr:hypothetical protein K443DRAFT_13740 [Laccaria amethystina LaAM-08-1]